MEQLKLFESDCESNLQNNFLTTPCRVQKRLFIPCSSSSKRSLFREEKENENISETDSDLGPMSPLALTDHSSCDSSPGRQFISPFATPEKISMISISNYDHLKQTSIRNDYDELVSSSNSVRQFIKSARLYQKSICKISAESKLCRFNINSELGTTITTDSNSQTDVENDVVPETPIKEFKFNDQESYNLELPHKQRNSDYRLSVPLESINKSIPVHRIYKRKPLNSCEFDINTSPEIKKCMIKNHCENLLYVSNNKYPQNNELPLIPKARTALFQENKIITKNKKEFILNPRSFYGSKDKPFKSAEMEWREPQSDFKKRRNLPAYSFIQRRLMKKHNGEINCGVGHGIRRPKSKRQFFLNNEIKAKKQNDSNSKDSLCKENLMFPTVTVSNNYNEKTLSKEIDHSKKFFKYKLGHKAIVTVNDNIKLKVTFNKQKTKHIHKKTRLDKQLFDATDLSEAFVEPLLEENKVVNILKLLENDWAEDNDEAMETAQIVCLRMNTISPKISNTILKDVTMSPASELSSMASVMNIEDITICTDDSIAKNTETMKVTEISNSKLYPLFSKGYSSNIINVKNNSKKRKRTTSWQLSVKSGNVENQYQIDAGQKTFGINQCNECGVLYHIGDPDDENAHLNHHNNFKILKFPGWKNERVIYEDSYNSSHIILIEPKDSNLHWKKVNEILEIVDNDLGLSDMKLSFYRDKKVYMYVRNKTILGILVAEYIKHAFKMIPELIELNCCTSEVTEVKCGINVVWTALSHRRQGIATKLIDILRTNYYYGYIMSVEDIAFSTPTLSGKLFAEKYTKTRNFKVY